MLRSSDLSQKDIKTKAQQASGSTKENQRKEILRNHREGVKKFQIKQEKLPKIYTFWWSQQNQILLEEIPEK